MPTYKEDGNWRYRKKIKLPDGTKLPRFSGTAVEHGLPNTREGAEEAERLHIARVLKTGTVEPPKPAPPPAPARQMPTLEQYAREHWLPNAAIDNKPTTADGKRSGLAAMLPMLGSLRLDQLDTLTIDAWRRSLVDRGLGTRTVNKRILQLHHLLSSAKDHAFVTDVAKVRLLPVPPREVVFLSQDEVRRLLAVPVVPILQTMLVVALQTGLRIGELRALHWGDIDFEGGRLFVRRTFTKRYLMSPKSNRVREVPIPPAALSHLRAWRELHRGAGPDRIVFPSTSGGYLGDKAVYKWIATVTMAAGVRQIGWHILRHTYASTLVRRRVSMRALQKLLGHSSVAVTEQYAHLAPGDLHDAVRVLDDDYGQAGLSDELPDHQDDEADDQDNGDDQDDDDRDDEDGDQPAVPSVAASASASAASS